MAEAQEMSQVSVTIRVFKSADQAEVIGLWDRCGLLRPWNDPKRDIRRKVEDSPELFLIAEVADRIIGTAMVGYDGHRGAVNYLAVDPPRQTHGIGRALMTEVERRLTERGCPKLNILIRSSNLGVKEFYVTLGYEVEDVICVGKRLIADD
jgi:ribosomal protein S18 acetylase RimI-like enzyme